MISLTTLLMKYFFVKEDGTEIVDLTRSSLEYLIDVEYTGYTIVNDDFIMRPDLVSESVFGDPNKFDYLLKFNGISNPLSLYSGQVILIPNLEQMEKCFRPPTPLKKPEDLDFVDFVLKPKTKSDKKRLKLLQDKAKNKNIIPPNINIPGDDNIIFKDDKIILGSNISNIDPFCGDNTSRARVKKKLLNKKIFG